MTPVKLKDLAIEAYVLGLKTIGEAANNRLLHYDLYWNIDENLSVNMIAFEQETDPYFFDSIDKYLSEEDKKELDADIAGLSEVDYVAPPNSSEPQDL